MTDKDLIVSPNNTLLPGLVYTKDLVKQFESVESFVKTNWKKTRRSNVFWRSYSFVTTVMVILLTWIIGYTVPNIRLLPVFFGIDASGMMRAEISPDNMQDYMNGAAIKSALFQYVQWREGYIAGSVDAYNHYRVDAMSSPGVREQYDAWTNPKNLGSHVATMGTHGALFIDLFDIPPKEFHPAAGKQPGSITIYYKLTLKDDALPPQPSHIFSTTFTYEIDETGGGMDVHDILTFNPLRLFVTNYPGPQDRGISQNGMFPNK